MIFSIAAYLRRWVDNWPLKLRAVISGDRECRTRKCGIQSGTMQHAKPEPENQRQNPKSRRFSFWYQLVFPRQDDEKD